MRQSTTVTTAPAVEPVTVDTAKAYLRVDGTTDDGLLADMIQSAREMVEAYLRRSLITQTIKLTLDWFPMTRSDQWFDGVQEIAVSELYRGADYIKLPLGDVQSITSLVTYNQGNTAATFNSSNYYLDAAGDRLILNDGQVWPSDLRDTQAIEVTYVAGYGDAASDVPASIKQGILQVVNALYNGRGCDSGIPDSAGKLLSPYRILGENYNGLR